MSSCTNCHGVAVNHVSQDCPKNISRPLHTSNTDHDQTLKEQIGKIINEVAREGLEWVHDQLDGTSMLKDSLNAIKETKKGAEQAIMQLITQARIDELEQLWNSTQPDIVPDGIPANDMSEALHKRIEKLRSEL